ncbi:hypothetical protein L596_025459 [Steinernema carpocapsae]|uniref:Uncharacterized protein n=1 Tax=Steinernema carpocapsae TaxID=34508 RepID=A0A4V5ZYT5_STECR|nr:hypothetical protein L596_025459 [Steinernema carpocapsae]
MSASTVCSSEEVTISTVSPIPGIKNPKSKKERDDLRQGFEEDDNSDIGYLNFEIIWPCLLASAISYVFIGLTVSTLNDYTTASEYTYPNGFYVKWFGKVFEECNNSRVFEPDLRPSVLRQIEMQVFTNVCFRISMLLPITMRLFQAVVIRCVLAERSESTIFVVLNNVVIPLAFIEILSSALFAIVTIRFDFPEFHRFCMNVFAFAAFGHMACLCVVSILAKIYDDDFLSKISILVKLVSFVVYSVTAPNFFTSHQAFITEWGCHGYVPQWDAYNEYFMFVAYLCFHSTKLIDIRHIRFICFPRTCSGECEPVDPVNFAKGGKFEYCRSYELRQRQVLGI